MSAPRDQHHDPALELDCREMPCPMPVIELARHLGDVAVGELLAVVAHDPPPSERSAPSIALPCGSRMPVFRVTVTRAFMRGGLPYELPRVARKHPAIHAKFGDETAERPIDGLPSL